jgi:hypothetical protein
MDDLYAQVGGSAPRVGVTVQRSQVAALTAPDPRETQKGGAAFDDLGVLPAGVGPRPSDPHMIHPPPLAGETASTPRAGQPGLGPKPGVFVRPLRDPTPRSIAALGGRPWLDGGTGSSLGPPPPTSVGPDVESQPVEPGPASVERGPDPSSVWPEPRVDRAADQADIEIDDQPA